jgi:hypothetical protein
MAADHEKGGFIGELKQDAILETGPDFPIVGVPVFCNRHLKIRQ